MNESSSARAAELAAAATKALGLGQAVTPAVLIWSRCWASTTAKLPDRVTSQPRIYREFQQRWYGFRFGRWPRQCDYGIGIMADQVTIRIVAPVAGLVPVQIGRELLAAAPFSNVEKPRRSWYFAPSASGGITTMLIGPHGPLRPAPIDETDLRATIEFLLINQILGVML